MNTLRYEPPAGSDLSYSITNRELFRELGAFVVNIVGGAGSGKTSLIKTAIERLILSRRIGVITADPETRRDAERLVHCAEQVVQIVTGPDGLLRSGHIHAAIEQFNLASLDLLLIENVSSLIGPDHLDLGQNANVALFSVAAGDDKAAKYPAIVRMADLVILNKIDLLDIASFDLAGFSRDVRRINPAAPLIEISTLRGDGMDSWFDWLRDNGRRSQKPVAASPPIR